MEKNSSNFSMQEATRLINSDAGKQLIALLQSTNDPNLKSAMEQAAQGNIAQATATLNNVTLSPDVQALLRQLGGK